MALFWSFPLWLAIAAETWAVTRAFGIDMPFTGTFLLQALLVIGVAVPTPGGVGSYHEAYRFGVTTFFGAPNDAGGGRGDRRARHRVRARSLLARHRVHGQDGLSVGRLKALAGARRARDQETRVTPMKCPFCGHLGDKVVDSRESKEGEVIRRRRECLDCGRRFTSYERIDEIPYMVIKKDGTRERFERQKLVAGLLKACEKRPVSIAAIESVADKVEATLQDRPEKEMGTEEVGAHRDGGAEAARQGRLRPLRVGLPLVPRRRRVHERAQGSAERQGIDGVGWGGRWPTLRTRRRRHPATRSLPRKPFRDNTSCCCSASPCSSRAGGLLALASRSSALAPDFLAEFVLYALSATNLTMLVALVFVLARNIIKLVVERRRALPFARFRAQAGHGAARHDAHPGACSC